MPTAPALEAADLRATYRRRRGRDPIVALDSVSIRLDAGEAVALLGPNGSGKSTLMRIACGLQSFDSGSIALLGSTRPSEFRARLGVVFQSPALDPSLTIAENLLDQARLFGIGGGEARRRVDEGLEAVGLSDRRDSLVRTLSGGMRRRADLCRALLHRPALLLLDEPTAGLDPVSRRQFLDHLDERRRTEGIAVMMSTHLVDEAERLDRVVLLDEGRVVADDAPASLRRKLGAMRITASAEAFEPDDGERGAWTRERDRWTRAAGGIEAAEVARSLAGRGIPFTYAAPDLADVFESLTGHALAGEEREA